MSDNQEHGPESMHRDNLRETLAMVCACGFHAYGDTWEEAGGEMDDHIKEAEEK